jgi:predicted Zn-dependent protease with MMP-like domain
MLTEATRKEFDETFNASVAKLSPKVREYLQRTPVVLTDEPTSEMLEELGVSPDQTESEIYGLHSTIPLQQRKNWETPLFPGNIYIFRGPLVRLAKGRAQVLSQQIEVTVLHEIAHQFGLDKVT